MKKLVCLLIILAFGGISSGDLLYVVPALPDSMLTGTPSLWVRDTSGWNGGSPTVVSWDRTPGFATAVRSLVWTPSGGSVELLGLSGQPASDKRRVQGVSGDGSVIVGWHDGATNPQDHAVRFYADGTTNATRLTNSYTYTRVNGGITTNGAIAFGLGNDGLYANTTGATFSTSSDNMVSQPIGSNNVTDASNNGNYLTANANAAVGTQALASRSGTVYTLTGSAATKSSGISDDGDLVVGYYELGANDDAVYWTWNGSGYTSNFIPDVVDATCDKWSSPAVSDDGNIVVGSVAATSGDTAWKPYIWIRDEMSAPVKLEDYLNPSALAAIPSGWSMGITQIISGDGTAITGWLNEDGTSNYQAYVTMVPEPATIAFLGLGGLTLIRRRKR